ncbi:MAG: hypothetical protein M1825_000830 [Sarcosagium campestre]|nr:MAG: hypothetical protein M1825_000830 [Sarcosagium campestre]
MGCCIASLWRSCVPTKHEFPTVQAYWPYSTFSSRGSHRSSVSDPSTSSPEEEEAHAGLPFPEEEDTLHDTLAEELLKPPPEGSPFSLAKLPASILTQITDHLAAPSLLALRQTSRGLARVGREEVDETLRRAREDPDQWFCYLGRLERGVPTAELLSFTCLACRTLHPANWFEVSMLYKPPQQRQCRRVWICGHGSINLTVYRRILAKLKRVGYPKESQTDGPGIEEDGFELDEDHHHHHQQQRQSSASELRLPVPGVHEDTGDRAECTYRCKTDPERLLGQRDHFWVCRFEDTTTLCTTVTVPLAALVLCQPKTKAKKTVFPPRSMSFDTATSSLKLLQSRLCTHLRVRDMLPHLVNDATGPQDFFNQRVLRCENCDTTFATFVSRDSVDIRTYRWFGDGKDPLDPTWLQHVTTH